MSTQSDKEINEPNHKQDRQSNNRQTVLDKGYIDFLEQFGDELTIVNAARVSFNNYHQEWQKGDSGLLKYLWRNNHMSPFRHVMLRMRIHAPEFVMRQLYKHVVGIEATSAQATKDHSWNEISQRYKEVSEFWIPGAWRAQSKDNKQASDGEIENQKLAMIRYNDTLDEIERCYNDLLQLGVAREQARAILPLSQYTTVIWTASLQAILNFIELRDHDHAQWEIREYAKVMKDYIVENFPTMATLI